MEENIPFNFFIMINGTFFERELSNVKQDCTFTCLKDHYIEDGGNLFQKKQRFGLVLWEYILTVITITSEKMCCLIKKIFLTKIIKRKP